MNRCWAEITIECAAPWTEIAAAALNALGANGVAIQDGLLDEADGDWVRPQDAGRMGVQGYFPVDDLLGERLATLRARLILAASELELPSPKISLRQVDEGDWAACWKTYYHPIRLGRLTIAPRWEAYRPEPEEIVIRLDPGLAFGAGTHPSTQQSLYLLQRYLQPGGRVLDIGTGCGILALAAALLGAGSVLARDIDRVAVEVARENMDFNQVADVVTVEQGDLALGLSDRFGLILANLVAPLLIPLAPALPVLMAPGAVVIMAGIIDDKRHEVEDACKAAGLRPLDEIIDGDWVALAITHH